MTERTCSVEGCDRPYVARGLCSKHYQIWWKATPPEDRPRPKNPRPPRIPAVERFWSKVDKTGPGGCWLWTASHDHFGYGNFRVEPGGLMRKAHRVAWEFTNGSVPDGLCVLHACDNPPCVNPAHLWLGTKEDNNKDRGAKGRGNRDMSAATAASVAARQRRRHGG